MMRAAVIFVAFSIGLCLGVFLGLPTRPPKKPPIQTGFCFLLHNRELFKDHEFLTSARILLSEHGEMLEDPTCPDHVLTFQSMHQDGEKVKSLDDELAKGMGAEISITFVGTLYVPSRVEEAYESLRYRFGRKHISKPEVIISEIISSGKPNP